ncbi:MAG: hypothetical protein HOH04_08050, partial [Rhodospirillaceae bacterium]|nr:hypothetical protein [Rhodospirillaceae bacterium]
IVQLQDQASFNAMFDAKEREQAVVEPEPVAGQSKSGIAKPTPVEIDLTSLYEQLEAQNQASPRDEMDADLSKTWDEQAQDSWSNAGAEPATAENLENWEQWLMVDWDQIREEMAASRSSEPGGQSGNSDSKPGDKEWSYFHFTDQDQLAADMESAEDVSVEELKRQVNLAEVVARPVWDLESKKASAIACVPVATANQTFIYGDALVASNPMGVVTLGHDRIGVHWAGRQDDGPPACVPVHFESLATMRNRHLLFTSFLEMPPEARRKVLGELLLPADIYSAAVEDVVRLFQPFVGRIIVSCDLNWRHFGLLRALGIRVAGFSLAGETSTSEEDIMGAMADFAAGAKQSGIDTYVKDLPSRNLAMAAAAVGVRYAFSTPKPMAEGPSGPVSFRLEDLY